MQQMRSINDSETKLPRNNIGLHYRNTTIISDSDRNHTEHRNIYTDTTQMFVIGILVCSLEGVCEFAVFSLVKTIKDKVDDELFIGFWLLSTSAVFSSLLMLVFEYNTITLPHKIEDIIYLAVHSLSTGIAYILVYLTVLLLPLVTFSIVVTAAIPMEIVCQYVIVTHLQPIKPGFTDLMGAIIITVALVLPPLGEVYQIKCKNTRAIDDTEYNELTPISME